jgi:DNA-binding transcriptional ArsR family regulator
MPVMDVFAAIAQPTRRSILEMLAEGGQLTASDIAHKFRLTAPAISQHLKVLREAHLVRMHKHRQQHIYEINPETVQDVEAWARQMTSLWNERFDRLDHLLQEQDATEQKITRGKDRRHDRAESSN